MTDKYSKNNSSSHYNEQDNSANSPAYFIVKNVLYESDLLNNEGAEDVDIHMNIENTSANEEQEKIEEHNEKKEIVKLEENVKNDESKDEREDNKEVEKELNIRENKEEDELSEIREEFLPQEEVEKLSEIREEFLPQEEVEKLSEIREEFLPLDEEEEEEGKIHEKNNNNYPTFSDNINSIGKFIFYLINF